MATYYHRLSFNQSCIIYIHQIAMLQNKIYQNFIKEILKTFFVILFGLTMIAWTVKAVNFLDLIVDNGYSTLIYFKYSFLNIFGVLPRFIPLSFLLALTIFILNQIQENEFIILWTSGVEKIKIINLFFGISIFILFFHLLFSTFLTPLALNKSRLLINKDGLSSFLPTLRVQQFNDSFRGFTFFVQKRTENKIEKVFIHDKANVLKNLTSSGSETNSTTIVAESGLINDKSLFLFNGQIISNKKDSKTNIIKFERLNLELDNLKTDTIKSPKMQETSTLKLLSCMKGTQKENFFNCKRDDDALNEIKTVINKRVGIPFYIPIISLLCSFLLIHNKTKKKNLLNKYSIFCLSFLILLYAELLVRYTGLYKVIHLLFIFSPLIFVTIFYILLIFKLSKESLKA